MRSGRIISIFSTGEGDFGKIEVYSGSDLIFRRENLAPGTEYGPGLIGVPVKFAEHRVADGPTGLMHQAIDVTPT